MMTTPLNHAATVRDLFCAGTPAPLTDTVAQSLHEHGTLKRFPLVGPALTAAEDEVARATDELLSMSLVDLLAGGWKKYDALKQAARRTRAVPDTEETVVLVTHHIDSIHHPSIELWVDGTSVGTIEVTVCITFTVTGVRAVVSNGRLTKIKTGTCETAGSVAVAGIDMIKKQRSLDLPGAVRLRGGIPLLEDAPIKVSLTASACQNL